MISSIVNRQWRTNLWNWRASEMCVLAKNSHEKPMQCIRCFEISPWIQRLLDEERYVKSMIVKVGWKEILSWRFSNQLEFFEIAWKEVLEIHSVHLKQSTSEKYQEGYEEKFSVSSCNSNRDVLKDQSSINRLSKPFLNLSLQQKSVIIFIENFLSDPLSNSFKISLNWSTVFLIKIIHSVVAWFRLIGDELISPNSL